MLETTFYNKLAKKLKAAGWFVQKIHQGRFGQGFPDCVLIDPDGETIYLELKVGDNKLSALQKKKLREIDNHGAIAIVGRFCGEATFQTIQEVLDKDQGMTRPRLKQLAALTFGPNCQTLKTIWEEKKK